MTLEREAELLAFILDMWAEANATHRPCSRPVICLDGVSVLTVQQGGERPFISETRPKEAA